MRFRWCSPAYLPPIEKSPALHSEIMRYNNNKMSFVVIASHAICAINRHKVHLCKDVFYSNNRSTAMHDHMLGESSICSSKFIHTECECECAQCKLHIDKLMVSNEAEPTVYLIRFFSAIEQIVSHPLHICRTERDKVSSCDWSRAEQSRPHTIFLH